MKSRITVEEYEALPDAEKEEYGLRFRDMREIKRAEGQLKNYQPCKCGSGKKTKFCCGGK